MDFQTICRICIKKSSETVCIFGSHNFSANNREIFKVIKDCASVQIQRFDGLSEHICQRCLEHLSQAYSFKKLCEDSDYRTRNGLITNNHIEIKSEFLEEDSVINYGKLDNDACDKIMETEVKREQHGDEIRTEYNSDQDRVRQKLDPLCSSDVFEFMNCEEPTGLNVSENYDCVKSDYKFRNEELLTESESEDESLQCAHPPKARSNNSSQRKYRLAYKLFTDWRTSRQITSFSEQVLMAYFEEISKKYKASTLWKQYSMLKSQLNINDNVDIAMFTKLKAFLKSDDFQSKNAKSFTSNEIDTFIKEAPDEQYVVIKMNEQPEGSIGNTAKASESLLPKSKEVYEKEYDKFQCWRVNKRTDIVNETVLLEYFEELSESFSPNSLWTKYSMLKRTLLFNKHIDIGEYRKLVAYLKRGSEGYEAKRSKVLTRNEVLKFVCEAPNKTFLMVKVALLFGIFGGCRLQELVNMLVEHIEDRGSVVVVNIPETKAHKKRVFTIIDEKEMDCLKLIRRYASLRPRGCCERRFFLNYRNGCCTAQPVGKNTFGKIPSTIATYLGLRGADKYTGHCLRRTSATLFADAATSMTILKRCSSS